MMYLKIMVKAKLAGRLSFLNHLFAGTEVIAELTGCISAVYNTTESNVTLNTCSIPHDASTFQQMNRIRKQLIQYYFI